MIWAKCSSEWLANKMLEFAIENPDQLAGRVVFDESEEPYPYLVVVTPVRQ